MLQLIQQKIHRSAIPGDCEYTIACTSTKFFLYLRFAIALLRIHHPGFAHLQLRICRCWIISLCAYTYLLGRIRRNSPKRTWAHKCEFDFANPRDLVSLSRVYGFPWICLRIFAWIRYGITARIHEYAEL